MSDAEVSDTAEQIIAKHLPLLYGGSWQGQLGAARGIIAHLEAAGYSVARAALDPIKPDEKGLPAAPTSAALESPAHGSEGDA